METSARTVPFTGVGVALLTLFDDSKAIDLAATAAHARRLVDLGVQAVLVSGTTAEVSKLTDDERLALFGAVTAEVGDDTAVVAGVGAATTAATCRLATQATDLGVHCLLAPPVEDNSVIAHFDDVQKAAPSLPVLAYHWPAKYPPGVSVDELAALGVAGCKDSTGDPKRLLDEVTQTDKAIYTGSVALLPTASLIGTAGALLGAANAFPELAIASLAGDAVATKRLHVEQQAAQHLPSPQSVKFLTAQRFGTSTVSRL